MITPLSHASERVEVIQQLAGKALQIEQVDDVLFINAGWSRNLAGRCHRALLPNSLRNSMRGGLPVTVDVFPARTRGWVATL